MKMYKIILSTFGCVLASLLILSAAGCGSSTEVIEGSQEETEIEILGEAVRYANGQQQLQTSLEYVIKERKKDPKFSLSKSAADIAKDYEVLWNGKQAMINYDSGAVDTSKEDAPIIIYSKSNSDGRWVMRIDGLIEKIDESAFQSAKFADPNHRPN